MNSDGSFLTSILEQVRFYTDLPTTDAKYSNAMLVQNVIYPTVADILARLNLNQDNPIVIRHSIALVEGQQYYQLPPTVQEIWRLASLDENGRVLRDAYPRGVYHPSGPGWSIEGNVLSILPFPQEADSIEIWYVPTTDVLFHKGTGYLQGDEFVLSNAPTLGLRDRRHNAYTGCILRLIPTTGVIQERMIKGYDAANRVVHLRLPFNPEYPADSSGSLASWSGSSSSSGGFSTSLISSSGDYPQTVAYEIAPPYSSALWEAIALGCSVKIGIAANMRGEKLQLLEREYKKAMKTITDNLANLQMRVPKHFDKHTTDNPGNKLFFGGRLNQLGY